MLLLTVSNLRWEFLCVWISHARHVISQYGAILICKIRYFIHSAALVLNLIYTHTHSLVLTNTSLCSCVTTSVGTRVEIQKKQKSSNPKWICTVLKAFLNGNMHSTFSWLTSLECFWRRVCEAPRHSVYDTEIRWSPCTPRTKSFTSSCVGLLICFVKITGVCFWTAWQWTHWRFLKFWELSGSRWTLLPDSGPQSRHRLLRNREPHPKSRTPFICVWRTGVSTDSVFKNSKDRDKMVTYIYIF